MTVDRYLSIQHPIAFFNSTDFRSRIRLTICLLFVVAFLVFIPSSLQKILIKNNDTNSNQTLWKIDRNHMLNHSGLFKIYLFCREVSRPVLHRNDFR